MHSEAAIVQSAPTIALIRALHQGCGGLIELRSLTSDRRLSARRFVKGEDRDAITRFMESQRSDHVYFGIATRNDTSGGGLSNCHSLPALFADIDFKHTFEAQSRKRLEEWPLRPSAIILSGGGLHAYWFLRQPMNLRDEGDRRLATSLLRRLAIFLVADMAAAEPARVLRLPGSLNHKYAPPREVVVELLEREYRYDASDFDALLPQQSSIPSKKPFTVPEKILDGQRNDILYKAARSLKARGLGFPAIQAAINQENQEKCVPPLSADEVSRLLTHAWNQADRPEFVCGNSVNPIEALRKMSHEEVKVNWMKLAVSLDSIAEQECIKEVQRLTNIGLRPLKKVLAEYKSNLKAHATNCRTGARLTIKYHPEDVAAMAELAEKETLAYADDFELVSFAGVPARVVVQNWPMAHRADTDLASPPIAQIDILNKTKLLPLVERAVVFQGGGADGPTNMGVPEKVLDHILVNSSLIPKVSALVTHPVVTMSGRIVEKNGIDEETGLLLYGSKVEELRAFSQSEAQEAVTRIIELFAEGFEFETPMDFACAVGMLFTALERKMLPMSPGALITAAQQSVGKTTLAGRTHVILTGREMPVMTWPEQNEPEANKLLFSALLASPALICFDNIGDGLTFKSPSIAAAMTSAVKEDRILGLSRIAKVPTNTFFVLTGNNTELSNDEVHRWIRIRLKSSEISPHRRKYRYPDVVK